jgi:hypothetical protein
VLPAVLLAAGVSCGDIDGGTGHFPGTVTYDSPAKDFHFNLLEPPWVPVTLQTETFFLVPSSEITVSVTTRETDALYSLHVIPQSADAATAFAARAATQGSAWNPADKQPVTSVSGKTGFEISWQESAQVFHREAHINGATAGSSFQLHFNAKKSLADDPMIKQMIVSFGPGPSLGVAP